MITALANALACKLDDDSLDLLSAQLVQLGDTLAAIAVQRGLCSAKSCGIQANCPDSPKKSS